MKMLAVTGANPKQIIDYLSNAVHSKASLFQNVFLIQAMRHQVKTWQWMKKEHARRKRMITAI